jgi:hypothetical protein
LEFCFTFVQSTDGKKGLSGPKTSLSLVNWALCCIHQHILFHLHFPPFTIINLMYRSSCVLLSFPGVWQVSIPYHPSAGSRWDSTSFSQALGVFGPVFVR